MNWGRSRLQKNINQDEVEVVIRNLPNEIKTQQILQYLSIAGPIKSSKFIKQEQRYSAIIYYHDSESAYLCKQHLGDQYYKGRVLTITAEIKKSYPGGGLPPMHFITSPEDQMAKQIINLNHDQRRTLFGLLNNLKGPEELVQGFLESQPKIVAALLGKYLSDV